MNDNRPVNTDDRLVIAWLTAFDLAFVPDLYRDEATRRVAQYLFHTVELIALDIGLMEGDMEKRAAALQQQGVAPTFQKLVGVRQ